MLERSVYSFENEGPFRRAYIRVFGRSALEALELGRVMRSQLADELQECTCWPPTYRGFDREVRRHYAEIVVALGGDQSEACRKLEGLFGSALVR